MSKTKILIVGLGGVGGYFGGKLAKRYTDSESVQVDFIARGNHLDAIKEKGIHIISESEDFFAKPSIATDDANEIGIVDFIILATKSYDLASSIDQIRPCINQNTIILPLLNGCDITERLRVILPENIIWSGCVYIVSRKTNPGLIQLTGSYSKLTFGYDGMRDDKLYQFEKILKDAEINVYFSKDIRKSIWEKFFFISVTASLTSYYRLYFGDLIQSDECKNMTINVANEFLAVAKAEGIDFVESAAQELLQKIETLPKESTTSMHSDFLAGNSAEVETLTGVVVELGHKHGIPVPNYEKVYKKLMSC